MIGLQTWHNHDAVSTQLVHQVGRVGLASGDSSANTTVYGMVIALVVIGVLLVILAVWLIRQTRVDPDLLAPLERMSESKWRKGDVDVRRALLDDVRPPGAHTPNWQDPQDAPVTIDLAPAADLPPPLAAPAIEVAIEAVIEPAEPSPIEPAPIEPTPGNA